MNEQEFYILINNKETGPFSAKELEAMLARDEITPKRLYAKAGMTEWQPLSAFLSAPLPQRPLVDTATTINQPSPVTSPSIGKARKSPYPFVFAALIILIVAFIILCNGHILKKESAFESGIETKGLVMEWRKLKSFTVTTNTDSAVGDVIKCELTRYAFLTLGNSDYKTSFSIFGKEPVIIDEGATLGIESNGRLFVTTNELPCNSSTNDFGHAHEFLLVQWPAAAIYALTNANTVIFHFNGRRRQVSVPLREDKIQPLRLFARWAVDDDARLYKPVK